jgi:hypothetical protein
VGLIDRIRAGTYVADAETLAAPGRNPSLAEVATGIAGGEPALDAVRDFLDRAGRAAQGDLVELVSDPPAGVGDRRVDALLAGIAEYLAVTRDFPCPAWTQDEDRFLERFWFVSKVPGFRAVALAQTPISLKRRGIFWPERSLQRV